jgi:ligand-binding sensor domain-containing protein
MRSLIQRLNPNRRPLVLLAAAAVCLAAAAFFYVARINRTLTAEQDREAASLAVEVSENRLRPPSTDGVTLYLNASDARAVATFDGVRYLATSGGLIALDDAGQVRRRYTTLDGLPENDLTSVAVFRDRLFIGTASRGLLGFDGDSFTSYSFIKPKAARVSVLAPTETELLIGTLDQGLFEYDGERFTRRFNSALGADFSRVSALLRLDSRLYIGTLDRGLYVWREAHIERVGTAEGLPSPRVTSLARLPSSFSDYGSVAVATDFGVVGLTEANEVKPISNQPNVTSLAASGGRLWAGLFGGGILDLRQGQAGKPRASSEAGAGSADVVGLPRTATAIVYAGEGSLWALTKEGAFARDEQATRPAFEPIAGALVGERVLTGDHITSLARDGVGRLWVGYFDRGIDVIAPETSERLSHVEDDRVREINFVAFDPGEERVLAATSRGLVSFDSALNQTVFTRLRSGLVNDSVAHVTLAAAALSPPVAASGAMAVSGTRGQAMVLATAGGLTEVSGGRARSLTAFHGLASNHLYTSAAVGSRLYVGSLAGLVELEGLRVVRTYKTSNSRLSHDWVTALAEAEGTLYVGTNGGGVDALLPTGEWVSFADQLGRFEVNQSAMHFDGERLYVGTSERGLLIYDHRSRRWTAITAGLPSQSVTAITTDDQFVYAGTQNGLMKIAKRVIESK